MSKRYYWLKLQSDFFDSKRIKKLRQMAGGDTYTIIYLKMQLLSIKTDGVLTYTGLEDTFADELALDLNERPDDVRMALAFMLNCGLAEMSDNVNLFLPYAAANTGTEGASAQRMRELRERQKNEGKALKPAPKTPADRQKAYRAKQNCAEKQHIPMVDDDTNRNRYGGNYFLVCQREKYRCAMCGSIENLCVHHIDGYEENNPSNNGINKLILLCRKCHSGVHYSDISIPSDILDSIGYEETVTSDAICDKGVTQLLRLSDGEIEKEIEIEIDKKKESIKKESRFAPPTAKEVEEYIKGLGLYIDGIKFCDFYESKGWMVGKNKMKDWRAAARNWARRDKATAPQEQSREVVDSEVDEMQSFLQSLRSR